MYKSTGHTLAVIGMVLCAPCLGFVAALVLGTATQDDARLVLPYVARLGLIGVVVAFVGYIIMIFGRDRRRFRSLYERRR